MEKPEPLPSILQSASHMGGAFWGLIPQNGRVAFLLVPLLSHKMGSGGGLRKTAPNGFVILMAPFFGRFEGIRKGRDLFRRSLF